MHRRMGSALAMIVAVATMATACGGADGDAVSASPSPDAGAPGAPQDPLAWACGGSLVDDAADIGIETEIVVAGDRTVDVTMTNTSDETIVVEQPGPLVAVSASYEVISVEATLDVGSDVYEIGPGQATDIELLGPVATRTCPGAGERLAPGDYTFTVAVRRLWTSADDRSAAGRSYRAGAIRLTVGGDGTVEPG